MILTVLKCFGQILLNNVIRIFYPYLTHIYFQLGCIYLLYFRGITHENRFKYKFVIYDTRELIETLYIYPILNNKRLYVYSLNGIL